MRIATNVATMISQTTDDTTKPTLGNADTKHQGKYRVVLVDTDRDGIRLTFYDTTVPGKPDLVGYFPNQEVEPYRVSETYSLRILHPGRFAAE